MQKLNTIAIKVINFWKGASYDTVATLNNINEVAATIRNSFMIGEAEKLQAIKTEGCIFFFRNSNILADYRIIETAKVFEVQCMSVQSLNELEEAYKAFFKIS
jgi:uncharacterized protein YacL